MSRIHYMLDSFLILAMVAYLGLVYAEENPSNVIAIVDFRNTGQNTELNYLEKTIPEAIITALAKSGRLAIVERSRMQEALNEMQLSTTGLIDEKTAVAIGQAVGANAILLGSYAAIGEKIRINARLIDVQTSKILTAESVQGRVGEEIFDLLDKMALAIERQLVGSKAGTTPEEITEKATAQESKTAVATGSTTKQAQSPSSKKPVYKRPVFWVASGLVVGGGVIALLGSQAESKKARVNITVLLPL